MNTTTAPVSPIVARFHALYDQADSRKQAQYEHWRTDDIITDKQARILIGRLAELATSAPQIAGDIPRDRHAGPVAAHGRAAAGQPATPKQIAYLRSLARRLVPDMLATYARDLANLATPDEQGGPKLSKSRASTLIDIWTGHGHTTPRPAPVPVNAGPTQYVGGNRQSPREAKPLPNVPAGYYAVKSATGNNDLDFFKVDRPTDGKWTGYVFVRRVVGGQSSYGTTVRGSTAAAALAAIVAAGIPEAGKLYGQNIGRCWKCGKVLTDEVSRSKGEGPGPHKGD